MGLEVGMIAEGKVTGITKFGAFVELEGGKTGMVHISEVAPTYVNDIKEYLKEGQTVKVKVLSIGEDGKISLSIKKALPQQQRRPSYQQNKNSSSRQSARPGNFDWQSSKRTEPTSFEDMMSKFKQTSDEKMSDLKRMNESKRGGYSRRGGNQQKQ
ncbi:MAG: S1 RNA-binding domain-containing protein [Clostridia bacterium]|nr:S1 RNA-binding domain-containing protein [Clostridia bacterium]